MRLLTNALMLLLVLYCNSLHASDNASVEGRLKAAADTTSLDSPGTDPWHWKIDVTVYDSDGKKPKTGTIEAWYADDKMHSVMTLDGASLTTLRVGHDIYRSDPGATNFVPLEAVFMQALDPIPSNVLDPSVKARLVAQKVGNMRLDCIEPTFDLPKANTFAVGAPLSYCFSAGTDNFVV